MDDTRLKPILIVEDEPGLREVIQLELEAEGYPVYTAENGRVALERLEHNPVPGLILLDLMMPVMNGWECLAAVRASDQFARVPVVVLSAFRERAKVDQADGYLRKPVELDALLEVVRRWCGFPGGI